MEININDLAGGALAEKVNIELRKLAANVLDPNTESKATRSVTVKITVKPNEKRQLAETDISVTSALAPSKGIPTSFIFDFDKEGKAVVKELVTDAHDVNQMAFDNSGEVMDGTGQKVVGHGRFR
jgi:hypothetical protein